MDYQNEEIEEVILDENEVAEEETDSIEEEAPSSAQQKQMKNVAAKKGMAEDLKGCQYFCSCQGFGQG